MDPTITQNGSLYALHHRPTKKYSPALRKRMSASVLTITRSCFQKIQRWLVLYFGSLTDLRAAKRL
jgi:hypothetical protein